MRARSRLRRFGIAALVVVGVFAAIAGAMAVIGHRATSVMPATADLGTPSSSAAMEAALAEPGIVELETVAAADWAVDLAGLVDLDDPRARAAGLSDRREPIQIYFHALRHPTRGLFIIDTGIERALKNDPERALLQGVVKRFLDEDAIVVHVDTATWLAQQPDQLRGAFLTHSHIDHVLGLPDLPRGTPVYMGPGEAASRSVMYFGSAPILDRALEGLVARELVFAPDPDDRFAGVLDVFGDGSFWALHVPGHTPGSVAFLARTANGPVLVTGDASHTRWGWDNGVAPGEFSLDRELGANSLQRLLELVADHPEIDVRIGHQR